jgi:hypothetical protein
MLAIEVLGVNAENTKKVLGPAIRTEIKMMYNERTIAATRHLNCTHPKARPIFARHNAIY